MIYTDNKDFYPTPKTLFDRLTSDVRSFSGRILEPSAGKGDIIDHIYKKAGWAGKDSVQVDAIEPDSRLVDTLVGKGYNVVWDDFLTYETYKEYDFIVMNPPFSNGVDHVLKALELAEQQLTHCRIYAILNKETINNAYTNKRQELLRKLDAYNASIEYVSEAFTQAERKTDVEVALIRVDVEPLADAGGRIYDEIPLYSSDINEDDTLETALSTFVKNNEIADKLNDIERYVLEYEKACRVAKTAYKAMMERERFYSYLRNANAGNDIYSDKLYIISSVDIRSENLNEELDRIRRGYWELILDTDDFREHLTTEGREQLMRRLSKANEMEINLTNIKTLLMAIGANKGDMLVDTIVSMFKRITKHHMNEYSTNIHYYNGWKTNDAYRINKKIIVPISSGFDGTWDFKEDYDRINRDVRDFTDDLNKVFKLIKPDFNEKFTTISTQEFENDMFRFKMFLNGNIHVWFKDLRALDKINYIAGQHFNWIPSEGEQKENEEARRWVAKEFGDMGEVKLLRA